MNSTDTDQNTQTMNGARLRAIRTLCHLTPRQFADRVGVSTKTLTAWELSDEAVYPDVHEQALADYALFDQYVYAMQGEHAEAAPGEVVTLSMYRHGEAPADLDRGLWNAAVTSVMRSLEDEGLEVAVRWG